jgi:hypothetical protein
MIKLWRTVGDTMEGKYSDGLVDRWWRHDEKRCDVMEEKWVTSGGKIMTSWMKDGKPLEVKWVTSRRKDNDVMDERW